MKTLVSIPEELAERLQAFRKKFYPHLSLGKMLVNCTVETMNQIEGQKAK